MYTSTHMDVPVSVNTSPVSTDKNIISALKAKPFMKWVGGKGQLVPQLSEHLPRHYDRYFEPFLGGGALFFALQPKRSFINDINKNLMGAYLNIKGRPQEVISYLCNLAEQYSGMDEERRKVFFYEVRERFNKEQNPKSLEKTVDLIFLNKTCFNGMYRENSKGGFNVPFGDYKNPTICNAENILAVSKLLKETAIASIDFESAVKDAKAGDFIYFDPPYHPLNATSSFTSYSADDFSAKDQEHLRDMFADLDRRGCFVMLSNSDTPFIESLYEGFSKHRVLAARAINSKASGRGKISEILVTNY